MAYTSKPYTNKLSCFQKDPKSFYHHKNYILKKGHTTPNHKREVRFNYLLYNKSRYNGLGNITIGKIKNLSNYYKISILWLLCSMNKHRKPHTFIVHKLPKKKHNCSKEINTHIYIMLNMNFLLKITYQHLTWKKDG